MTRADILAASARTFGWLSDAEAAALYDLAHVGPGEGCVVEIGSFVGKSTIALAGACLLAGREGVIAIDPHTGSAEHQPGGAAFCRDYCIGGKVDTYAAWERNVGDAMVGRRVQAWRMTSAEAAERWGRTPIRLLYVDGAHDTASVAQDLALWTPHVTGIVAVHDAQWASVREALDAWQPCEPSVVDSLAIYDVREAKARAA